MSFNYVSGYEYSGRNADALADFDGENGVVTFKQALRDLGVSGKALKGIKAVASLVRFSKTEKEEDANGKLVAKPIYYSVFDAAEVLKRKGAK